MCNTCVGLSHTCPSRSGVYRHYSHALAYVYSQSGTYWRHGVLANMAFIKWHVLETWCSCIHGTYEVAYSKGLVLCSCIRGTREVARIGGVMSCSPIHVTCCRWHVLETWCSCIHGTYKMARTGGLMLCSCICGTREVAHTRGVMSCFCIRVTRRGWNILET